MSAVKFYLITLLYFISAGVYAQVPEIIEGMEASHKTCLAIKPDSVTCSRIFFFQLDSMLSIVLDEVKAETPSNKKASFIKEQISWASKKQLYFKKQDENFVYNIKKVSGKKI